VNEVDAFQAAVTEQRLLVQRCEACGRSSLPPSAGCPHCGGAVVALAPAAGTGVLRTWTVCHVAFDDTFVGEVPYVVGLVELDEGARLVSTIDAPRSALADGLVVELAWRPSPADGRPFWVFREPV